METIRLTLFDTAIGTCGLAWSAAVVGVQLPEATREATAARMGARFPAGVWSEPLQAAASVIASIVALTNGTPLPLTDIEVDEDGLSDFERDVYRAARQVLPGTVSTYGRIAEAIGAPGQARAVGQALGRNPFPILVPCHRILAAGGKVGGFSGAGGIDTKLRLLTIERAELGEEPSLFDVGEWPLAAVSR